MRIVKTAVTTVSIVSVAFAINAYKDIKKQEEVQRMLDNVKYFPSTLIEVKEEEIRKQEEYRNMIDKKRQEIANYIGSYEYKLREETRDWRLPLGITVDQIKATTFKNTAYSSLSEENGGYTTTFKGEPLKGNIVANNTLPYGTRIYMNGKLYRVADKGSSRFNNPNRLDVLVERIPGETDDNYRQRVSDYGVQYTKGYIIKEG